MRIVSWFGRPHVLCHAALIAVAAGAAAGSATPASAADLYTERYSERSYEYQPAPPPPPAYAPPRYVPERYSYRPYRPAYPPSGWADPYDPYRGRYVEVEPRPPAPVARPWQRSWAAYPRDYDEEVVEAAPPTYRPFDPRW